MPRLIGTNSQCWLPAGQEFGKSAVRVWHSAWLKHLHCVIMMVSVWQSWGGGLPPGAGCFGNTFRHPGVFSRGIGVMPRSWISPVDAGSSATAGSTHPVANTNESTAQLHIPRYDESCFSMAQAVASHRLYPAPCHGT